MVETPKVIDLQNLMSVVVVEVENIIDRKLQLLNHVEQKKELYTTREASSDYGQSEGYWKKQIYERNINFVKMGKSVKLKRVDIEKFISQRTIEVV